MNFQRAIGPWGLLFAGISSVIGSGWLFGPLFAAQIAGPAAIISWLIGGFLMIFIALTFAELGTTFPVAGGVIQYAQKSYGSLMSFLIGWMVWISSVAIAPVETMGLLQYAANYIPGLMASNHDAHAHILSSLGIVSAAGIMLLMCVLNYYGAHFFSRSNTFITAIKLIVPTMTIVILIGYNFHFANFAAKNSGFAPYGWHGIFAALPLGGVIYSFLGSNSILQLAGETKDPHRTIPFALIGSMIFCTVLYLLLQIAFVGAMQPDAYAAGWDKLHYEGDHGPFSGIMMAMGLSWFVLIIYADAMISPFGTGYVYTASTSRVAFGLSEIGFLPSSLQKLTQRGVPFRCILLNFFIGLVLFLPFPSWQKLAGFVISCCIISYIIGPISLVALRKIEPDLVRPFQVTNAKFIALFAFYICNLLIFWTGWETVSKMMIALLIGFIFYAYHCCREKNKLWKNHVKSSWWVIPYLVSLSIISCLGTFGAGKNIIPFGIDFAVVGVVTVIIFFWALKSSVKIN